ncbi:MAG: ABC transporter ATP-binding protein, partial [Lachnospiraceae bacterium]|nr:ABC transporter ATP-binding protein [Lachnospiraceae bacterium]
MRRWFKYIKPYLPYFILGPLCMIVEVIGEVLMPKFLSYIIDYGAGQKDIAEAPEIIKWLLDVFGGQSPFIIAIMVGMIITAVLMMLGGVGGAYFGAKAAVNFAADLREDLFRQVQKFSFANIDKFNTGSLVTRLTNDVTQMMNFINMLLRMCLRSPGMLIGGVIMAVSMNAKLTLTLAVSIPLLLITVAVIISVGFPRFAKMQEKIDGLNSTVQESITNARVVKSFVREDFEIEKFHTANKNLKMAGRAAVGVMIFMSPVMTFIMNATTIAVLWFGGNMLVNSTMSTGDLTAFVTYVTQILSSLMMITFMFVGMSRALASGKRIAEVLDEKIDITDENLSEEDAQRTVQRGEIEFKNVSFRYYKNSEEKVIDDVSLKIDAGKTVGIIGSTGSGKTTLISLISRLYDADEGEVLIDGVNVKDYSLYNLRE